MRVYFLVLANFIALSLMTALSAPASLAQTRPVLIKTNNTSEARIVEDVPGPTESEQRKLVRVSASETPSGFSVPRYVSLKYDVSNGRTGPSSAHPVAWRYKKRALPMIVIAETETWRKVRDVNGDESWMNRRLLTGTRTVLARTDIRLRAKPRSDSKERAIAGKGALLKLEGCETSNWCQVRSIDGNDAGFALKSLLWGAETL